MTTPRTSYQTGRIFVLRQQLLENGRQLESWLEHLQSAILPAAAAAGCGAQLVLEAFVSSHQPQVLYVQEFPGWEQWRECEAALFAAWDAELSYMGQTVTVLAGTTYSPPPVLPAAAEAKVFELRTYQAPTVRHLEGIHERFSGPEIPIFHRVGIRPILFGEAIAGPQMPNMTYLTPFPTLAEREAAWTRFQGDPEWHAVRQASIEKYGYTPRVISIALYHARAFVPGR